jgi:hypothetical protein
VGSVDDDRVLRELKNHEWRRGKFERRVPRKWISADGLTRWSVFSVYGEGGKQGINAHDKFNLIKAALTPVAVNNNAGVSRRRQ